jgi:hypothetical protein
MNLLIVSGIILGFAVLLSVLGLSRRHSPPESGDESFEFSPDRYKPMDRLLRESDYAFLGAQPGFDPAMARKLRRARHRIYFSYLRSLSKDFYRVHHAAVQLVLESGTDRPELSVLLAHHKFRFQMAMCRTYAELALSACGLGTVDPAPVLNALRDLNAIGKALSDQASA